MLRSFSKGIELSIIVNGAKIQSNFSLGLFIFFFNPLQFHACSFHKSHYLLTNCNWLESSRLSDKWVHRQHNCKVPTPREIKFTESLPTWFAICTKVIVNFVPFLKEVYNMCHNETFHHKPTTDSDNPRLIEIQWSKVWITFQKV